MKQRLARWAYACALWLLTPAYVFKLWHRGRIEPLYRWALAERFGLGLGGLQPGALWLHAVSLGETLAARALIDALRRQRPGLRLLLTHGTATGRDAGKALLQPGDQQCWLPYDSPAAVRRFLQHSRPVCGVLMETEVWPNLMHRARGLGLPMVLANARLSEKSARRGHQLAPLMRPAAEAFTLALAQTAADAMRLTEAGVPRVQVSGNLKYDLHPDQVQWAIGKTWRQVLQRQVLAATNTREGEEAELLALWRDLPQPRPLLLLVPRHPQRFDAVAGLVEASGLRLARRSQWTDAAPAAASDCDVWLGDTLGEMALYYGMADLALLGGSFAPLGGHNLIEAAACACPILLGPSTYNFAEAAELAVAAGAAWRVGSMGQALNLAAALWHAPDRLLQAAHAAQVFSAAHRGAAVRMAEAVLSLIPASEDQPTQDRAT